MAIVGTGGIAQRHAAAAASVEGVDLVAVCDISAGVAQRFAAAHQIDSFYSDVDSLLQAQEIDIASVCTWGTSHAETSIQLARSGKVRAILCEKPISSNAAECAEMIAAAKESGVLLAEAFKFRHHPLHLKMKELVEDRSIGDLRSIRSSFVLGGRLRSEMRPEMSWNLDPARGGGCVYDLGCYNIHHARFIAGTEPTTVFARGELHPVCGVHDQAAIHLGFPGGVTAEIAVGYYGPYRLQTVEICGTEGYLRADLVWNNSDMATALEARFASGRERYEWAEQDSFVHQLRHMKDCLEQGIAHRIQPQNSLDQMRTIDAVFESMESGNPVPLDR
jgi:predicted dehydrogenase